MKEANSQQQLWIILLLLFGFILLVPGIHGVLLLWILLIIGFLLLLILLPLPQGLVRMFGA